MTYEALKERVARRCYCRAGRVEEVIPLQELDAQGRWVPSRATMTKTIQHQLCHGTGYLA